MTPYAGTQSVSFRGGKIKVVEQYRDDKHEELVLEERQFADSLISEHVIFLTEGLYKVGSFFRDLRRSLYVKTDGPGTPVLPKRPQHKLAQTGAMP